MGVAQLVRAPGCGPGGRGFETPRSPHFGCRHRVIGAGRAVLFRESHWLSPSVETRNAPLAQLVEQRTLNPQVLGSIPRGRTNLLLVACSDVARLGVLMSYGASPQPVEVPVPFPGTEEEKHVNRETHNWVKESLTETVCTQCGVYVWMVASNYPCGEDPPTQIIFKQFT